MHFGNIHKKNFQGMLFILLLSIFIGGLFCVYRGGAHRFSKEQIWEVVESPNGKYRIESVVTHEDGSELYFNGTRLSKNAYGMEYSPSVNNRGDFAYAEYEKSIDQSRVVFNGKVVFDNRQRCLNVRLSEETILFSGFSAGKNKSVLYKYSLKTKEIKNLLEINNGYIDDIRILGDDYAVVLVEEYNPGRICNLYEVDLKNNTCKIVMESEGIFRFARGKDGKVCVDRIEIQENKNLHYLYNGWYHFYHFLHGEPFSNGNDFRGNLSWTQAARIQALLELYKKTKDEELKDVLCSSVVHVLEAQNSNTGVKEDEFNPSFLWSSKKYSLKNSPVAIMVNNCVILDALLSVASEGILEQNLENEIYDIALKAVSHYEKAYEGNGHYRFLFGAPIEYDGVIQPWNQQNVMIPVMMRLWEKTGEEKYLLRMEEMLRAFREEWVEQDGTVVWHYWPKRIYDGWSVEEKISINTPEQKRINIQDAPYEDVSHAGFNALILARYAEKFPNGIISKEDLAKIQKSMENFCLENGYYKYMDGRNFSLYTFRPSAGWSYFQNQIFERDACFGGPNLLPWGSAEDFLISAKYYHPNAREENDLLIIERYAYQSNGNWEQEQVFPLQEKDIKAFVKESYREYF